MNAAPCPVCGKRIRLTVDGARIARHLRPGARPFDSQPWCPGSNALPPAGELFNPSDVPSPPFGADTLFGLTPEKAGSHARA